MSPRHGSFRGGLIFVPAVLLITLFAAASYLNHSANATLDRSRSTGEYQQQFMVVLSSFKSALHQAEVSFYEYAVLTDDAGLDRIRGAQERAHGELERLRAMAEDQPDPRIRALVAELGDALGRLDAETKNLQRLLSQVDSRYPVSPLLARQMGPVDARFEAAVGNAITIAETVDDRDLRDQLLTLLHHIRYHWSQQVSVVRLYVANQSGTLGPIDARQQISDRLALMNAVEIGIERVRGLNQRGKPDGLLAEETDAMEAARRGYEQLFTQLVGLYETQQWRAEVPFLRDRLKPQFAQIWGLINTTEEQLAVRSAESLSASADTMGTLARFLWLVTALAAVFVISTYFAYTRLVRGPIEQVTEALRALERGSDCAPVVRSGGKEIEALLHAFGDMQQQVRMRETRLAAILANAGEGIITINEAGIIETFNNAAEKIFGYDATEVIGKDISPLMPPGQRKEHVQQMRRHAEGKAPHLTGREIIVTARRKDGSLFPMSLKVTDVALEGHHLFTAMVEDISERKALMDHLRQLAEHDSLTGLYNRQYFLEQLERVVQRAKRQGGLNCALLYIDLDNFKFVNDTLGHQAGDRVLVEVAAMLAKRSRGGDVIARLGGDEFAVMLFDVDEGQAHAVADHYRQLLTEYSFRHDGRRIDVGCSIGVALLAGDVNSKEELMSRADISCYTAKRAGRNSVHLYHLEDRHRMAAMSADMSWARTIKHAIENDRFDFALQPIVNVMTGQVEKHEALLRMLDAEGQPIMPSGFVPSAERFGLILEIDHWVVEHAVDLVKRRNHPDERLAINLSGKSLADPGLVILATRVLEESGISPHRLTFEITETVAISDLSAAIGLLEQLRDLGCDTALDDFGACYSSFAYLKDLPVDYVKIDGSFVRNIDEDASHLAMVKSMNEIVHAMGKKTVAEFVANDRVLSMLREIGVDYAQGYHMGAPELAGYPDLSSLPAARFAHA